MSVYVITDGRYFKIGYTDGAVEARIDTLQTGNPNRLILVHQMAGGRALEKELHGAYAAKRLSGEWFDLSNKDLKDIRELFCVSCGSRVNINDVSRGSAAPVQKLTQTPVTPISVYGKDVTHELLNIWVRLRAAPFPGFSGRYPTCDISDKAAVADALSRDQANNGIKFTSIDKAALLPVTTSDRPWILDLLVWLTIDAQIKLLEKQLTPPVPTPTDPDNLTF
jgi:hypothetical protein